MHSTSSLPLLQGPLLLYSYMLQLYTYTCRIHFDAKIKTSEDFFKKIYTSHFIVRFACERELETEQRLQHIDLPTPDIAGCYSRSPGLPNRWPGGPVTLGDVLIAASSHQLLWSPNSIGGPKGPSAGWWLSLPHLVSNPSDLQLIWGSRGPLLPGGGFLYHILSPTSLNINSLISCLHRVM